MSDDREDLSLQRNKAFSAVGAVVAEMTDALNTKRYRPLMTAQYVAPEMVRAWRDALARITERRRA
jgi:hypothetical protein